jgi:hypothetical protein
MRVGRFVMCILLAACAHAATAADLLGRYGPPVMHRFAAGNGIVVGVEYNKDGRVTTVEIAPVGYKKDRNASREPMDRAAVSELLDYLIPDQMRMGILSGLECPLRGERREGSCGVTQTDLGVTLYRRHIEAAEGGRKDLVVTITSKTGLPQTVITLESRFGAVVAERFVAEPGIALTATYDKVRAATEIAIAPMRSVLETDDEAQFMPVPDVERILDEIAPRWTRTGSLGGGSMQSGCNETRIEEFDNLSITRSFHHCHLPAEDLMMQTVVRWGARRMMPGGGNE